MDTHGVSQSRHVAFGFVCIEGTGMPTHVVFGAFMAGEDVRAIAAFHGLTVAQVEAAIRYEGCRRERTKAHAWARELRRRERARGAR